MQGKNRCRLNIFWITGLIMLLAVPGAAAGSGGRQNTTTVTTHPVGLVMDSRANAYTVDRFTGKVFCLPAGTEPVHYATVSGEPTALAVDHRRKLFIGTRTGLVLTVDRDGTVSEICRCPKSVTGLTLDRDGSLLIATSGGTIIRMKRTDLVRSNSD